MDESKSFSLTPEWTLNAPATPTGAGRVGGMPPTVVTIATPDRAAQSRTFARSARRHYLASRLVILAIGADGNQGMFEDLYDLIVTPEQLGLGCLADMRFRYSTAELCFALKPWVIRHLLEKFPDDAVYYFDSDIELFAPLVEVEAALSAGANVVLTPHILHPTPDQAGEQTLLRSGSLNAGFIAVAPSAAGRSFVAWWGERLRTGSTLESTCGDQKWLDLVPAICDGVAVLRHPGYNFAFWNAHERKLSCLGGTWVAAGEPLRFVHYTKWNLWTADWDQYLAKYFCHGYQSFSEIFADYQNKVRSEDRFGATHLPPVYGQLLAPSGEPIPDLVRNAYARHGSTVDGDASAVFTHMVAAFNAPSSIRADLPELPITVLADEIWERHGDLRYRFNADEVSGRLAYLQWLVHSGVTEIGIPAAFMAPVHSALERERIRQLEAGDEPTMPPAPVGDPLLREPPASRESIAALITARDVESAVTRRRDEDIRLLVGSNKTLRREVQALRVRRWRNEETIPALETELAQIRRTRDKITQRNRQLADAVLTLHSRSWFLPAWRQSTWGSLADRCSDRRRRKGAEPSRRSILPGDGPFFNRGFHLGQAAAIDGATVRRIKDAPSGTLIFGPYLPLPMGTYAITVEARLYDRLPVLANFTLDVVCDQTRQLVGIRVFRVHPSRHWQRFELIFTVWDGVDYPDFETRIWSRKGIPLEIGRMDLYRLTGDLSDGAA